MKHLEPDFLKSHREYEREIRQLKALLREVEACTDYSENIYPGDCEVGLYERIHAAIDSTPKQENENGMD